MAACSICNHPQREAIDLELVNQKPLRIVAKRFGVTGSAVFRHKRAHLGRDLESLSTANDDRRQRLAAAIEAQRAQMLSHAGDLLEQVEAVLANVRKLFDACDAWLVDPDNPGAYDLSPRAGEILVRYTALGPAGRPVAARARLSALLTALAAGALDPALPCPAREEEFRAGASDEDAAPRAGLRRDAILSINTVSLRTADPRELLLKAARRLEIELQLLHRLLGQLALSEPGTNDVDLVTHPEWIRVRTLLMGALEPYPDARAAVVDALEAAARG